MNTTNLTSSTKLKRIAVNGYEEVYQVTNPSAKLIGFIAVHSTACGPSLGGIRIYPYTNFDDALEDVLRLAKGMTYKSAASNLTLGGGKSVIIADRAEKTPEMLEAFADAVNQLEGRYICAEDVNCTVEDAAIIATKTKHIVGLNSAHSSGDPSYYTAWGTYFGIQAVCEQLFGSEKVKGKTFAIQGLGAVGLKLADILFWHGAKLIVSDLDETKVNYCVKRYGSLVSSPNDITTQPCDVFVPCAMGAVLSRKVIAGLNCKAVAGAANNQLATSKDGSRLKDRGILYAPDFLLNAGGIINVYHELESGGYCPLKARDSLEGIRQRCKKVLELAAMNNCTTEEAALHLATEFIDQSRTK